MKRALSAGSLEFFRGKHIVITGGLGFLGSSLAARLASACAGVTLLDAMLPGYGANLFNISGIKKALKVIKGDIRDEKTARVFGQADLIFHIAAQTDHLRSMKEPGLDIDINLKGTINILEAARKSGRCQKIVYAGTRAQYGKTAHSPVSERDRGIYTDIYSIDKQAGEDYCMLYKRNYGLNVTSARLSNTYGPRHQMKHPGYGVLNWFVRLALEGKKIPLFGDGSQKRDFLYIDDAVTGLVLAAYPENGADAVNIGSGRGVSLRDAAKAVVKAAGSGKIEYTGWPDDRKKIETGDYIADISLIKKLTGFSPAISLSEGLSKTALFYRKNRKRYWQ